MSEAGDIPRPLANDAGTTLIETLVVVAVTAMAALIGFPRLQQGLVALAQHEAAAVAAAHLRAAQAAALKLDRPMMFAVGRDGRTFGSPATGEAVLPAGVTLAAEPDRAGIAFYGDGSSSGGVVWVRGARRATALVVNPASGAVAVQAR